jgi:murein DD-endopeptidase MepM/ murein hydrolase activator NlpD
MANTTVEIIGGQLSGVLQNAASDATLQEIVRAVNKLSNSTGGNARAGAGAAPTPTTRSGSSIMESAMDMVGNQIGNLVGAMGSFAGLIASGNDKLSSYTSVLNDQIIKGLPLVGKYLGAFGDIINYSIGTFEEWNASLKQASKTGAAFNNSILELRSAANGANLSLDDFVSIISSNSEVLVAFGGTVTAGAKAFADYNKYLKRDGGPVNNTLRQMGYSSKDVSEILMTFMKNTQRGVFREKQSKEQFEKQFMFYSLNIDRMVKLTGQTAQQLENKMAGANQDAAYQAMIMTLGGDQQNMMDAGLRQFVATYGDAGAELWKAISLGQQPQTDLALDLMTLMPFAGKGAKDMITSIKNGSVEFKNFDGVLQKSFVAQNMNIKDYYLQNQSMINAMSLIEGPTGELYRAIKSAISGVGKYGKISDLTVEKLNAMWKAAKDEADKGDAFTRMMNALTVAFEKFYESIIDTLMPMFKDISETLKENKVQEKIKSMGEELGKAIKEHLPKVTEFLRLLGSSEGRSFLLNELGYYWDVMTTHAAFAIKRSFVEDRSKWAESGLTDADKQKVLDLLAQNRVNTARELGYNITPAAPPLATDARTSASSTYNAAQVAPGGPHRKNVSMEDRQEQAGNLQRQLEQKGIKILSPTGAGALPPPNSRVGPRAPVYKDGKLISTGDHGGNDYALPIGTPIFAGADGKIHFLNEGEGKGYGNYVVIEPDGVTNTQMYYAHLQAAAWEEFRQKFPNGTVKRGEQIGKSGNTGASKGPHVHYEIRHNNVSVPLKGFIHENAKGEKVPPALLSTGTMGTSGASSSMSVEQMESIAKTGGTINIAELITTFNTNMATLIEMTKERQSIHYQQLDAQKQHSGNLALG